MEPVKDEMNEAEPTRDNGGEAPEREGMPRRFGCSCPMCYIPAVRCLCCHTSLACEVDLVADRLVASSCVAVQSCTQILGISVALRYDRGVLAHHHAVPTP